MIIQCEGCASKYFLPQNKIPSSPTRVSCPQCKSVFTLVPQTENIVAARVGAVVSSSAVSSPTPAMSPEPSMAQPTVEKSTPTKKFSKRGRPDDRARRLARVLVSDILCYNQDKRDQALVDGNLMTILGDEIKKSWELYKEKVGPDVASSTNYFMEALNEILADGQEVF